MGSRGSRVIVQQDRIAWVDNIQISILALEQEIQRSLLKCRENDLILYHIDRQIKTLQAELKSFVNE
jgi:hypothetical protein